MSFLDKLVEMRGALTLVIFPFRLVLANVGQYATDFAVKPGDMGFNLGHDFVLLDERLAFGSFHSYWFGLLFIWGAAVCW